uniref:DNA polymerase alpha subunit B n=1 Tax=Lepeophtheirus salmonis TaxID=72036 RepID=A0A0K2TG62_LEPSM
MKADPTILKEQFEELGYDVSNPQVVDGLLALCDIYNLSEDRLSCLYLTYSSDTPDSVEEIQSFETQILVPLKSQSQSKKSKHIHDANSIKKLQAKVAQHQQLLQGEDSDNLIALRYGQSAKDEVLSTAMEETTDKMAPPQVLSPFIQRINSGECLTKFGFSMKGEFKGFSHDIGPPEILNPLSAPYSHMFERLRETAGILDEILCRQADILLDKYGEDLEGGLDGDLSVVNTEPFSAFGRVCCEEAEGKLNSRSIMLQGSMDSSGGRSVPVDINQLKEYSLFPGQIIGIKGTNPNGSKLVLDNIISDGAPEANKKGLKKNRRELSLLISSGPYTTKDDLNFAPLKELFKQIRSSKPEVVIFCGPFLDERHPLVSSSNFGDGEEDQSYDIIFSLRIIKPLSDILNECTNTRVIMIPSNRDIHHLPIYPTPPFDSTLPNDRIHMLSDPCLFSLEGIVFGVTSTDILFHLTKSEISNPRVNQDRLRRLARHLLQQRSFYPLYPPNMEMCIDSEKCEIYAKIDVKPDVLILPSDLMHFIKDVDGTLVLNPSRLSKGSGGGLYSRMKISNNENENLLKNISANIVRI